MKRLIFIFSLLVIFGATQAQRFPFSNSSHMGAENETFDEVIGDGNTKSRYIAHTDYITIVDDSISVWSDSTANGYDLAESTTARRPTWGGDSVIFDGDNDRLLNTTIDFNQPFTIYLVIRHSNWTNYTRILQTNTADYLRQQTTTPQIIAVMGGGLISTGDLSLETWGIITLVVNSTSSLLQINNNAAETGDLGTNKLDYFIVGNDSESTEMSIKDIIVRSVADNSNDRNLIRNYLNTKYSIY